MSLSSLVLLFRPDALAPSTLVRLHPPLQIIDGSLQLRRAEAWLERLRLDQEEARGLALFALDLLTVDMRCRAERLHGR